jgi:hypothetical protein
MMGRVAGRGGMMGRVEGGMTWRGGWGRRWRGWGKDDGECGGEATSTLFKRIILCTEERKNSINTHTRAHIQQRQIVDSSVKIFHAPIFEDPLPSTKQLRFSQCVSLMIFPPPWGRSDAAGSRSSRRNKKKWQRRAGMRRKSWRRRGELFQLPPQRCADFDESMMRKHSVLFWSGKVTGHRREGMRRTG